MLDDARGVIDFLEESIRYFKDKNVKYACLLERVKKAKIWKKTKGPFRRSQEFKAQLGLKKYLNDSGFMVYIQHNLPGVSKQERFRASKKTLIDMIIIPPKSCDLFNKYPVLGLEFKVSYGHKNIRDGLYQIMRYKENSGIFTLATGEKVSISKYLICSDESLGTGFYYCWTRAKVDDYTLLPGIFDGWNRAIEFDLFKHNISILKRRDFYQRSEIGFFDGYEIDWKTIICLANFGE